jgi:hypothetical protein
VQIHGILQFSSKQTAATVLLNICRTTDVRRWFYKKTIGAVMSQPRRQDRYEHIWLLH